MAAPRVRDERLCWLSVKPRLEAIVHRRRMWDTLLTLGTAPKLAREWERQRMARYAVAVDRVAARLTEPERLALRANQQVPDWFLRAVRAEYRKVRR